MHELVVGEEFQYFLKLLYVLVILKLLDLLLQGIRLCLLLILEFYFEARPHFVGEQLIEFAVILRAQRRPDLRLGRVYLF